MAARRTRAKLSGGFPSFRGRLTFFKDLQGQRSGPGSGTPELKRKGTGPEDKAGAGARAEPAAEIQGSRPETGGVVRNPKRPAGSKPGREEPGCVGRRAPEALVPRAEGQDQGVKPKRLQPGARTSGPIGGRAGNPDSRSPERQESCARSPRGVAAEDHGFLGFRWGRGGASTPGSWREREAESHILRFTCVPKVESGTFSSGSCISLEREAPKSRRRATRGRVAGDLYSWDLWRGQDGISVYPGAWGPRLRNQGGYLQLHPRVPQGSLFLSTEVAHGDPGPTLWPGGHPWTLDGLGGHHPLPFGAHTYSGPDTVCGSKAGGLEARRGGRRRREGSVQEPGLAGGAGCNHWRAVRAQPPYTHPVQAGWAGSLLPLQGLPPAACQQSAEGRSHSRARCQPACRQEAPPPPVSPAPFLACAHPTLGTIAILAA